MNCDRYQALIISVSFMVKSLFFSPQPSTGYHLISEVISHRYFTLRKIRTSWPSHRTLINDLEGVVYLRWHAAAAAVVTLALCDFVSGSLYLMLTAAHTTH